MNTRLRAPTLPTRSFRGGGTPALACALFLADASARRNTTRNDDRDVSYMRFTADSPDTTKYRMEPRLAAGRYCSRARLISAFVTAASASLAAMSTDLDLALSSVLMRASLSRMLPCGASTGRAARGGCAAAGCRGVSATEGGAAAALRRAHLGRCEVA